MSTTWMSAARVALALIVCASFPVANARPKSPHVLLVVVDDYGWNDFGLHGSEIPTPILDGLARDGVLLDQYYVTPLCTHTRSALLSGKYGTRFGMQGIPFGPMQPDAFDTREVLMPQLLKEQGGYATHLVGKWHLGYNTWSATPYKRGFDSFLGIYGGIAGYYNHTFFGYIDYHGDEKCQLDFEGTHTSNTFTDKAIELVHAHAADDPNTPLFLYLAYQNVHTPLEADEEYFEGCMHIQNENRRIFCAMTRMTDVATGRVVDAFKAAGLWNDTLLILTTDNGGYPGRGGASNYPLRGVKATVYEGGVRANGFVTGGDAVIPKSARGTTYKGLMHVTDWLPTLLGRTSGLREPSPPQSDQSGARDTPHPPNRRLDHVVSRLDLDGIDQWRAILGRGQVPSPRTEMLITMHDLFGTAVRVGPWKLIVNCTWFPVVPPPDKLNDNTPEGRAAAAALDAFPDIELLALSKLHDMEASQPFSTIELPDELFVPHMPLNDVPSFVEERPRGPFLFHVLDDPSENNDLHDAHPDIVSRLLAKAEEYRRTKYIAPIPLGNDWNGMIEADRVGCWVPWMG